MCSMRISHTGTFNSEATLNFYIMKQKDILKLKRALLKAEKLETQFSGMMGTMARIIEEATGVVGSVDHLSGDGFGFTPESNNDTHVGIDEIIKWASEGIEITEELIDKNRSF